MSVPHKRFGVEDGAGYTGGDGQQIRWPLKTLTWRAQESSGKIDGAAAADAGGGGFITAALTDGELREQSARVQKKMVFRRFPAGRPGFCKLLESEGASSILNSATAVRRSDWRGARRSRELAHARGRRSACRSPRQRGRGKRDAGRTSTAIISNSLISTCTRV